MGLHPEMVWKYLSLTLALSYLASVHCCGSLGFTCPDDYSCHVPDLDEYCPDGDYECCFSDDVETDYTMYYIIAIATFFMCMSCSIVAACAHAGCVRWMSV